MSTMEQTGCPQVGTLRAYLDHEAPDHDVLTAHVRECLSCARTLRELRAHALTTDQALAALSPVPQPARAAGGRASATDRTPVDPPVRTRRGARRLALTGTAAAVALATIATPVGQSVAKDVLQAFQSKKVVAVQVTQADAQTTASVLGQLGTPSPGAMQDVQRVPVKSVAAAQRLVSFPVAQPSTDVLPKGFSSTPTVEVSKAKSAQFTFSAARTKAYLKQQGSNLAIPAGYDGENLTVTVPAVVALTYRGTSGQLIVGTAEPVRAAATGGMSLESLRAFLLTVPGIPPEVINQLGNVDALHGALPIPIPAGMVNGENTSVKGHSAVSVSQPGLGSGVLWQEDQRLVGVAGTVTMDQVTTIADSLARP